jgi:hypothetical protein
MSTTNSDTVDVTQTAPTMTARPVTRRRRPVGTPVAETLSSNIAEQPSVAHAIAQSAGELSTPEELSTSEPVLTFRQRTYAQPIGASEQAVANARNIDALNRLAEQARSSQHPPVGPPVITEDLMRDMTRLREEAFGHIEQLYADPILTGSASIEVSDSAVEDFDDDPDEPSEDPVSAELDTVDFDDPFADDPDRDFGSGASRTTSVVDVPEEPKVDVKESDENHEPVQTDEEAYDPYEPQEDVVVNLRDVIEKMKMGYTRTPDTKGYDKTIGSIKEHYRMSNAQINELYKHPKLKYAKTSFKKSTVKVIDDGD